MPEADRPKLSIRSRLTLILGAGMLAVLMGPFLRPAIADHYGISMDPQYQSCLPWSNFFVKYGPVYQPKVGMLLAFHDRKIDVIAHGQNILVVKYLAGVPGDVVKITQKAIWIDGKYWGKRWLMPWVRHKNIKVLPPETFTIPKGKYLLMGTTPGAYDGRYWGLVPAQKVVGRAWPL